MTAGDMVTRALAGLAPAAQGVPLAPASVEEAAALAGSLYFIQQASAFGEAQREVGPSAIIEELPVNGVPAEYARSAWEDAGSDAGVLRSRWNSAAGFGRLLWERDGLHFQISIDAHGDLETASRGPVMRTAIGDFQVTGARFVDEVNENTPGPGSDPIELAP